jgi:hypothetical protein
MPIVNGVPISMLPPVPVAPQFTDIFPAVQAGVTYKETLQQVFNLFGSISPLVVWTDVTGTSSPMVANNGYLADNAGLVTLTLPATAAQFSMIQVAGNGAGGWTIAQNAGQSINFGTHTSTVGVGGSLSSTNRYDQVSLLCVVANTTWTVRNSVGNLTIV